jgi:hypothetical protein
MAPYAKEGKFPDLNAALPSHFELLGDGPKVKPTANRLADVLDYIGYG